MTKADQVRELIKSFDKKDFTTDDLPRESHINSLIQKLIKRGEIEFCGYYQPAPANTCQRPRKYYRELKIIMEDGSPKLKDAKSPWSEVWPEFFSLPKLEGRCVRYGEMTA